MTALIFLDSCNSGNEPNVIVVLFGAADAAGIWDGVAVNMVVIKVDCVVVCVAFGTIALDEEGWDVGQKQGFHLFPVLF
jgi:hypothetical protein